MTFERIVLLTLLAVIVIGGFWADSTITGLKAELAEVTIDTVTVEVPLVVLDTVVMTESDTVHVDADTVNINDSTTIIQHYPTATVVDSQPLFTGKYTYTSKNNTWKLDYKYRNLDVRLAFPDKFDFRKVVVTTDPDLGSNIEVELDAEYEPYKPPKDIGIWLGGGYVPAEGGDAIFLKGGISWKKTYIGVTRSTNGWGVSIQRMLVGF